LKKTTKSALFFKGEYLMNMPKSISTWLLIVFFVFEALAGFGIFANGIVSGVIALAAAIAFFLGK